jgi:cytochrome d ubiquinol oxidase subunit I
MHQTLLLGFSTDLARWQFGVTTLYHYIFVPITLGLTWGVASMQTVWLRTGNETWYRMTRFWGRLLIINFALGVVTGIVQEFQFGMNWSSYSRYVGDIFGAPLALEGLLAFFVESVFLGVWIFGWNRLKPGIHLLAIWLVAGASWLSAYFILVANSWMQHPVGYHINPATHRAELNDFVAVLLNPTVLITFPHTVIAGVLTASTLVLGISSWHLARAPAPTLSSPASGGGKQTADPAFRVSARLALPIVMLSAVATGFTGHTQAQIMTDQQPMKMAAAEALWNTETGASWSLFAIGDVGNQSGKNIVDIKLPHLLSVLATNTWEGTVQGINDLQRQYQQKYGPGDYRPNIAVTYWTFRGMVTMAFVLGLIALIGLWLWWNQRLDQTRWFHRLAFFALPLPFLGNFLAWIFTEMGRQPWTVFGLLQTANSVSPSVSTLSVGLTLAGFTLTYGVLAAVEVRLMAHFARRGALTEEDALPKDGELPALMAY